MCAIVGLANLKCKLEQEKCKYVLSNMLNKFSESNQNDMFLSENVILGHKSLNIIDNKDYMQPMSCRFQENNYTITYNGKLYNSEDLRKELIDKGFSFEGNSDTEVLLKAYICFGNDVVNKLNGAFAFAIWNEKKRELFFARDHFGLKPFFYFVKKNNFVFASQIKCLLEFPRCRN